MAALLPLAVRAQEKTAGPAATAAIRLGVCTSPGNLAAIQEAGYDYLEYSFSTVARMTEPDFEALLKTVAASKIKIEAMNGFIPSEIKVVGPKVDNAQITGYLKPALERASRLLAGDRLGLRIVVCGSGNSRNVPEGFSRETAMDQLVAFLRLTSDLAKPYPGLTIVVEPLRVKESNIINTIKEGLELVKKVDRPNIRLHADLYHMAENKEGVDGVLEAGSQYLKHTHIANPAGRVYPKAGDAFDYKPFFEALKKIGYQGRLSIEAGTKDFKKDASEAYPVMRGLAGK
jgi:sugar phosphate isomerase/epimerase